MASAKSSSRLASSKQCGVGSSIAAALFISPNKPPSTQPGVRFLNIEVLDDTALIETSLFSKKPTTRPARKDWKIKNIKKGHNNAYSRAEMLALNLRHPQSTKWAQVYRALPASVAAEYDQLLAFSPRPIFTNGNDGAAAAAIGKRRSPLKKISVH